MIWYCWSNCSVAEAGHAILQRYVHTSQNYNPSPEFLSHTRMASALLHPPNLMSLLNCLKISLVIEDCFAASKALPVLV